MVRRMSVLLGGVLMGVICAPGLVRAQVTWTPLPTPTEVPTAREGAAAAWDPVEGRALYFGGADATGLLDDLWWWDPVTEAWFRQVPEGGEDWPTDRAYARMVFDPIREVFVLFGGQSGTGYLDDLWIYDPADRSWTNATPAIRPAAREGHAMFWASGRNSVILHGGAAGATIYDDVWAWNGTAFGELIPGGASPAAPARRRHVGFWNSFSGELMIVGGQTGLAVTGEMWAFHPGTLLWRSVLPAVLPPARQDAVLVHHLTGAYLFGGSDGISPLNDLWTWDHEAMTWTETSSGMGSLPAARSMAGGAYQSSTSVFHVFGGALGAGSTDEVISWSLGGIPAWSIPAPLPWRPQARRGASLGYSDQISALGLFGGDGAGGEVFRRYWFLDPELFTWEDTSLRTATVPARSKASLVALGESGTFLLYGGVDGSGSPLGDSWIHDTVAGDIREVAVGIGPPARHAAALAYDRTTGDAFLFGGEDLGGPLSDTWRWDTSAETWTLLAPGTSPSARTEASMATLPEGGVLLFGGRDATQDHGDAWIFEMVAAGWRAAPGSNLPTGPSQGGLVLDHWSYDVVHFGGGTSFPGLTPVGDTHAYDGVDWVLESPAQSPSARVGMSMAPAAEQGGFILFGGFDGSNFLDDLWRGSQPSPDPVGLDVPSSEPAIVICPPRTTAIDVRIEDALGRKVLDPSKSQAGVTVTLVSLPLSTQIISSTLVGGTPLPAIAQVGTIDEAAVRFTLSVSEPGNGELLIVPDPILWSNFSVPVQLQAGPTSETASAITASPPSAVTGVDVVTVALIPRDDCGNELGSGLPVSFGTDVGQLGLVADLGTGRYEASLTTAAADCQSAVAHVSALVDALPAGSVTVDLSCPAPGVDPASPVTSPLNARACARRGIFAEVTIVPRDSTGQALPPGRSVTLQENPPYLVAGQVRETTDSTGEPIYRIEVGSNRCGSAPIAVPISVDGVALTTIPQIRFECEPVDPATIALVSPVVAVPADGATAAIVQVVALDECGNPAFGRVASLDAPELEAPVVFTPSLATTLDAEGQPGDATVQFEARSAQAGRFDLRVTVDGRSALDPDALTFLKAGGLGLSYSSPARRGAPGQTVKLKLELTNDYDVPLEDVIVRPSGEGLKILEVLEVVDLGNGAYGLGGIPVGSTVKMELEAVLRPGLTLARSQAGVRFRLQDSGLEGMGTSNAVTIAVESEGASGCECGTGLGGESRPLSGAGIFWLTLLGLALGAGRRRRL